MRPSLASLSTPLARALVADASSLRIGVETVEGVTVVDAGINNRGGIEAGRRIAELCMGGLGTVSVTGDPSRRWPMGLTVHSSDPVLACLGSQYAGWALSHEGEGKKFFALGSGPARALVGKEKIFEEIGYADRGEGAAIVMETDKVPPAALISRIAADCGVEPENATLVLTPTTSLAGTVQVVARVLEVALHKAHSLGFPLGRVVDGMGTAPLPPPGSDFLSAMGRTNDAILYGGTVHLFVEGPDDEAEDLATKLPSSASRDHGRPFAEIFADYECDFYAVDALLFSPAQVLVTAMDSGRSFRAGELAHDVLDRSLGHG